MGIFEILFLFYDLSLLNTHISHGRNICYWRPIKKVRDSKKTNATNWSEFSKWITSFSWFIEGKVKMIETELIDCATTWIWLIKKSSKNNEERPAQYACMLLGKTFISFRAFGVLHPTTVICVDIGTWKCFHNVSTFVGCLCHGLGSGSWISDYKYGNGIFFCCWNYYLYLFVTFLYINDVVDVWWFERKQKQIIQQL